MVSLGIGLTSNCNLHCAHCYRDQKRIYNLTLVDIQKVCESLEISSSGSGKAAVPRTLFPESIRYRDRRGKVVERSARGGQHVILQACVPRIQLQQLRHAQLLGRRDARGRAAGGPG